MIHGANLNLDDAGNVESVLDAGAALEIYRAQCAAAGLPEPDVIVDQARNHGCHPGMRASACPGPMNG